MSISSGNRIDLVKELYEPIDRVPLAGIATHLARTWKKRDLMQNANELEKQEYRDYTRIFKLYQAASCFLLGLGTQAFADFYTGSMIIHEATKFYVR